MTSYVRGKVSKKKRRLIDKKNGFDLDLSYITKSIIAMGFPSENVEGIYRNHYSEVVRFLDHFHKDHYKVYNLCSERGYDPAKFYNRVEVFPFDDHNAPPFDMILDFCKSVQTWIEQDEKNIAVIHCKAGKGRTGLMICSWLLFTKEWTDPNDAMNFYAAMRTYNMKGVTIPSQIRYIKYFGFTRLHGMPEVKTLFLSRVVMFNHPKIEGENIRFTILNIEKSPIFRFKDKYQKVKSIKKKKKNDDDKEGEDEEEDQYIFECGNIALNNDLKVEFYEKGTVGKTLLFTFWFNTAFVQNYHLCLQKEELDKANKDRNHKFFPKNFRLEGFFKKPESDGDTEDDVPKAHSQMIPLLEEAKKSDKKPNPIPRPKYTYSTLLENIPKQTSYTPYDLAAGILRDMIGLFALYSQDRTEIISESFAKMAYSQELKKVNGALIDLASTDLNALKHKEEKFVFWANLLQALLMHAYVGANTLPTTFEEHVSLCHTSVYQIGGYSFSLLEIEHNILRAALPYPENAFLQSHLPPKFKKTDPRLVHAIPKSEPRTSCVVSHGTRSSPLLRLLRAENIGSQLEVYTKDYISRFVSVDQAKNTITLPQFFADYCRDFGKNRRDILFWIAEFLPTKRYVISNCKTINIAYLQEDWNVYYSIKHLESSYMIYLNPDAIYEDDLENDEFGQICNNKHKALFGGVVEGRKRSSTSNNLALNPLMSRSEVHIRGSDSADSIADSLLSQNHNLSQHNLRPKVLPSIANIAQSSPNHHQSWGNLVQDLKKKQNSPSS